MPGSLTQRYVDALLAVAANDLGRPIEAGTVVVGATGRAGSIAAVAYPLGSHTIIWCAPELAERLSPLEGQAPLTDEQYVDAAERLGGTFAGAGRNRVLVSRPASIELSMGRLVDLDPDGDGDRSRLADFTAACPPEDVDDAEIDLDDLDPVMSAVVDGDEQIISFASARPWEIDPGFDDIGVLTHPASRGRRLGAAVVSHFAARLQAAGRVPFYNHNVDNVGSQRVADAVGFEIVNPVAAVTFN